MRLTFCTTHEGMKVQVPKQIRVLFQHPLQGAVEGMIEVEAYGNAYIRIPDHLVDQADFICLRTRTSLGLDPSAPYMICLAKNVTFLS